VFLAAHARYGTPLPTLVQERLDWELEAIIGHGFAGIFHIAAQLVARSRAHGYLVGSRGSVGSSLVATLCGITEVNPLPPHYFCVRCRYVEFESDGRAGSGFDLPARSCPGCGGELVRDGQDIAFETFMGFHGEKVPDIDLNFSGECQAEIHRYAEELLGKHQVFRAGTIATLADKTAYGFVRHFNEENAAGWRRAEIDRLTAALTGVKRTTGQHPGGLMIVPAGRSMSEFSPVQFPADDRRSGTVTTHFAYEAIHDHLVKLDLLGHDDPTSLRLLQDLTGVDPLAIPFDDRDTLAIFSGLRPLGLDPADWEPPVGTVGIPEFGTRFVRRILTDTRPRTFSELVRVSGLSHGTDVWLNNAQELIAAKVADISQVISSRDDITIYLVHRGLPPVVAFRISESVRRGRGVSEGDAEAMAEAGVPDWFIASCQKIKYLFPKAHASAYVMMAFRIAYFKVHHPAAFYAAYFTTRAGNIDAGLLLAPEEWRSRLQHAGARNSDLSQREQDQAVHLEVALEMRARGIGFLAPDLYRSDATRFGLEGGGLRLPLSTLPGFGQAAATRVVAARAHGPFLSVEDLRLRCRLPRNLIELLSTFGCTRDLPDKNQIGLF
jgi:DNA polymerase-3 subunit alpha (Gram-positive type)